MRVPPVSEAAWLIGVRDRRPAVWEPEDSLDELALLTQSAGAAVVGRTIYRVDRVEPASYIGSGQVQAVKASVATSGANLVLFDDDLRPTQNRNLERALDCKVVDRTGLILDIFARRARSNEGKLQVELAQLTYLLPRLVGKGKMLSRLGGGIGTRGPGEQQLEVDRRRVKERIRRLRSRLGTVRSTRAMHRRARRRYPLVSLVGYTNSGKSTLFNALTGASVPAERTLFATLDPLIRRLPLPEGGTILLADTVGFIRKLPHQLIEAFAATFEEIAAADALVHVIDGSHPHAREQCAVVDDVLATIGLAAKPLVRVVNKIDLVDRGLAGRGIAPPILLVSARTGEGIDDLRHALAGVVSAPALVRAAGRARAAGVSPR